GGVVAAAVEAVRIEAAEVTNSGNGEADQPVEELPHAVAPQGDLATDRVSFPELEPGNRLLGPGDQRLLAADDRDITDGAFQQRRLLRRPAHAHVDDDLL